MAHCVNEIYGFDSVPRKGRETTDTGELVAVEGAGLAVGCDVDEDQVTGNQLDCQLHMPKTMNPNDSPLEERSERRLCLSLDEGEVGEAGGGNLGLPDSQFDCSG
jgi:hypothetical protein